MNLGRKSLDQCKICLMTLPMPSFFTKSSLLGSTFVCVCLCVFQSNFVPSNNIREIMVWTSVIFPQNQFEHIASTIFSERPALCFMCGHQHLLERLTRQWPEGRTVSVESNRLQGLSWMEGLVTKGTLDLKYFTDGTGFQAVSYSYTSGIQEQCVF